MDENIQGFDLMVTVPAAEMHRLRRRVLFLEATMIQVLRERKRMREWFTAAELAALRLPGLPTAKNAISRLAKAEGWQKREATGLGGARHEYHFSSLPRRAFEDLVDRVLKGPATAADDDAPMPAVAPAPPIPAPPVENAAPPWVLPLMRVMKKARAPSLAKAVQQLPKHLPEGVPCPTYEEALRVLRDLGVMAG